MKIAIIILNWNAGKYLYDAVQSAIDQSSPATRIIVVDNASTDDSLHTIVPFAGQVEIWKMPGNLGFAAAHNRVISQLDGIDWLALLNPDAIADKGWLQALVEGAERYPSAKSFASRMMSMDKPGVIDGAGDCYHISGFAWRRYHGTDLNEADALVDSEVFGPCGGAAFYDRQSYLECGGFDEDFFCYFEDVDLALRMQLKGMECRYLQQAVVLHKGGVTSGDGHDFSDFYGHRNLVWTWFKGMPWWLLVLLLPVHIAANLLVIIQKIPQGRSLIILTAKFRALTGLGPVLKKRQIIHAGKGQRYDRLWLLMSKSWKRS